MFDVEAKLNAIWGVLLEVRDALRMLRHAARFGFAPPRYVYLAGPILGCTEGEANDWRRYAADKLKQHNIIGISPLRCEPIHGETYTTDYPDAKFGTPRAIGAKNKFDVRNCDITLAILPKPEAPRTQSYGTISEIGWADETGKMTILISDDPNIIRHPVLDCARGWKLVTRVAGVSDDSEYGDLKEAIDGAVEVCIGVLAGYAGGRNV